MWKPQTKLSASFKTDSRADADILGSGGKAEITVTNGTGETGQLTLMVKSAGAPPISSEVMDMSANMDIRLEMVRLINQPRQENGLAEPAIDELLMNAAQDVSVLEGAPAL